MDKEQALNLLVEIKENIHTCCAITMEPDEVLVMLDEIETFIRELDENPAN